MADIETPLPVDRARFARMTVASALSRMVRTLAVQDLLVGGYLALLAVAVATGDGKDKTAAAMRVAFDVSLYVVGLLLTRTGVLREGTIAHGLVYRVGTFLPVFLSYFHLREIIPAVTSHERDAELLAFDLSVFGYEPAIAWDRFVTPHTTEWFSFFYFLYFFLLTGHVLPMLFAARSQQRLAHFALGTFMVFCFGHLGYLLVSGWGPYHLLEGKFEHPLEGGLFYRLVMATVAAGGSQRDIFPSLHTAGPTFFAIFAYQHRHALPWRHTWLPLAFIASQIIGATMFLRWHYLIDVIAGFTLAVTAAVGGHAIVVREAAWRHRKGLPPVFRRLRWAWGDGDPPRPRPRRR